MEIIKADQDSIVRRFTLFQVNGYKNIELESLTLAKIISAENGTGKTTILNALYGLLSGKYSYLRRIDFESLRIEFHGGVEVAATKQEILGSMAALLHKSVCGPTSPYPRRIEPTATVRGMPRAVKPFRIAARIWISAT